MKANVFEIMSSELCETLQRIELLDDSDVPYMRYRTEGLLEELSLWIFVLWIAGPLNIRKQAAIYTAATMLYRKNMGGWHAKTVEECQVLSAVTVISVVMLADRYNLARLIDSKSNMICVVTTAMGLLTPLAKAEHLCLDDHDHTICEIRKRETIVIMAVLELLVSKTKYAHVATYMMLGLLTTIISIGISLFE